MKTRTQIKERAFFFARIFGLVLLAVSTIKVWSTCLPPFRYMSSAAIIHYIYSHIMFYKEWHKPNTIVKALVNLGETLIFFIFATFASAAKYYDWNVLLKICYYSATIGYFLYLLTQFPFPFGLGENGDNIEWK